MEHLSDIRDKHLSGFEEALASAEATLEHLTREREQLVERLDQNRETSRLAKDLFESLQIARKYTIRGIASQADDDYARNLYNRTTQAIQNITTLIAKKDAEISEAQNHVSLLGRLVSPKDGG